MLSQDNHVIDVLEDLRRAQQSTTLDQTKRDFAGSAISEIEDIEEKVASQSLHYDRLRQPYDDYVQQILAQEEGMIGSFYDLTYLHNQISSSDYKQNNNFKAALKAAIDFHRNRYWHKRDWLTSGTKPLYAGRKSNPVGNRRSLPLDQASMIRRFSSAAGKAKPNNYDTTSTDLNTTAAVEMTRFAAPTFGSVGSVAARSSNSLLITPKRENPFSTTFSGRSSPFAFVTAPTSGGSSVVGGVGIRQRVQISVLPGNYFEKGHNSWSTQKSREATDEPVYEFTVTSGGKRRVLRRKRTDE